METPDAEHDLYLWKSAVNILKLLKLRSHIRLIMQENTAHTGPGIGDGTCPPGNPGENKNKVGEIN